MATGTEEIGITATGTTGIGITETGTTATGIAITGAGTAAARHSSGHLLHTIEDETGTSNLVVFQKLFDKYRKEILRSRLLMVEGKVQREGEVIHVVVRKCSDISGLLRQLSGNRQAAAPVQTLSRADENGDHMANYKNQDTRTPKVVQTDMFHGGRNFR